MRAVVSRVGTAAVTVDGEVVGEIGRGLLSLVGVARTDDADRARTLARKIHELATVRLVRRGLPVIVVDPLPGGRHADGVAGRGRADLALAWRMRLLDRSHLLASLAVGLPGGAVERPAHPRRGAPPAGPPRPAAPGRWRMRRGVLPSVVGAAGVVVAGPVLLALLAGVPRGLHALGRSWWCSSSAASCSPCAGPSTSWALSITWASSSCGGRCTSAPRCRCRPGRGRGPARRPTSPPPSSGYGPPRCRSTAQLAVCWATRGA